MDVRKDFPMLSSNPKVIYFDNACTTFKPKCVLDAQQQYYEEFGGCTGRSSHMISRRAQDAFESSRDKIAKFVNADIVAFSKNATESLNLVVNGLQLSKGDKVVTTVMEHHSLLLPLLWARDNLGVDLKVVNPSEDGVFDAESFSSAITKDTKLVAFAAMHNSVGTIPPVKEITRIAHDAGSLVLIDGAQSVAHTPTDIKALGVDFIAFSGHKMLGPTGIGCLAGRKDCVEKLSPLIRGGGNIKSVTLKEVKWEQAPRGLRRGIQNYAGAIGLGRALQYLSQLGTKAVESHELQLAKELSSGLREIKGVTVLGPSKPQSGIVTFNIGKANCHEVNLFIEQECGAAMRSGVFCAEPALNFLGQPNGAVRASLYVYNTSSEVKTVLGAVRKAADIFA